MINTGGESFIIPLYSDSLSSQVCQSRLIPFPSSDLFTSYLPLLHFSPNTYRLFPLFIFVLVFINYRSDISEYVKNNFNIVFHIFFYSSSHTTNPRETWPAKPSANLIHFLFIFFLVFCFLYTCFWEHFYNFFFFLYFHILVVTVAFYHLTYLFSCNPAS